MFAPSVAAAILLLAGTTKAWKFALYQYEDCTSHNTTVGISSSSNLDCQEMPKDLIDYHSLNFPTPLGSCRVSFATSREKCGKKDFDVRFDSSVQNACILTNSQWAYATIDRCQPPATKGFAKTDEAEGMRIEYIAV